MPRTEPQSIPLDQLTKHEIDFLIQKLAQDKAYEGNDDPIFAENEVKRHVTILRDRFDRNIKAAKAGKMKMTTVTPEQCGRIRGAKLRSPRAWKFRKKSFVDGKGKLPYTNEHLLRFGFLQHPGAQILALSNTVVAPMAIDKWLVTDNQKRVVDPILRLASKLVLSPASVRFLHAIIFNKPVKEEAATRIWDLPMEELRYGEAQDGPIRKLRRQVIRTLEELGEHVTWQLHDKNKPHWILSKGAPEMEAFTVKRRYVPQYQYLRGDGRRGADFFIDMKFMDLLENLDRDAEKVPESEVVDILIRSRMKLAVTICHELAHAVCSWIGSSISRLGIEPFFAPYNSTEIGYTWEQEVFGGIMEWTAGRKWEDEVRTPLVCLKWPHAWEFGDYFYIQDITETSTQWIRDYPKHSSTSYFVPMEWIFNLTLDRFWNAADERLDLLRPPKTFGYRQVSTAPEFRSRAWRRSQSSEKWSADSFGRVVRDPALKAQLPNVVWAKKSKQNCGGFK